MSAQPGGPAENLNHPLVNEEVVNEGDPESGELLRQEVVDNQADGQVMDYQANDQKERH